MDAQQALEDLIVNNQDLERLEDLLAEFNIFKVLGIELNENRHSAFLAWLLDPNGNHGLGDYFLRGFLARATSLGRAHSIGTVTPFVVDQWKLRDTNVETERHRIDILLTNRVDQFVCAIENKVLSTEHGNQLERYRQRVESEYQGLLPLYILLSVDGEPPTKESDAAFYIPIGYSQIAELVQRTLDSRSSSLGIDVQSVLRQYLASLRRYVLVDSEVQRLARQIYYNHKDAIELILEAKPDVQQEVRDVIESVMKDFPQLQPDISGKSYIRYYPPEWDQIPELREGDEWTETKRMLLFEFRNLKTLSLHLVLGPGPSAVRDRIIQTSRRKRTPFNNTPRPSSKFTSIYQKPILNSGDMEEPDFEVIKKRIRQVVGQFMEEDFKESIGAIEEEFRLRN